MTKSNHHSPKFGIVTVTTDSSVPTVDLAEWAEDNGLESLFMGEHSHILTSRRTPLKWRGVTALARSGIGPLLAGADGRALLIASCEEIAVVARAERVALPVEAVNRAIEQAATLPPQWRSSMARDLEDGRRLEVDALSGAVVRREACGSVFRHRSIRPSWRACRCISRPQQQRNTHSRTRQCGVKQPQGEAKQSKQFSKDQRGKQP